jgi:mannosyl-3-phosphoglycerate synthase
MILEKWHPPERVGNVKIKSYRVLAPEYVKKKRKRYNRDDKIEVKEKNINKILSKMAVVVPVCGEEIDTIIGVLSYIPQECSTIVVSNSKRWFVDRYKIEKESIREYFETLKREIKIIHQKDREIAKGLKEAGYEEILENNLVRDGKGEGLILGMSIAFGLENKDYVGFVDADNYSPASVREYVRDYAAGFELSKNPLSMVRLSWKSKPDMRDGRVVLIESGRTSRTTNDFINRLISEWKGYDVECIETGNAGEHAISKVLAENMPFASRYEIEPYEIINLLEEYGGVEDKKEKKQDVVDIIQIKTINPHFHRKGSYDHIRRTTLGSLGVIYHSSLCPSNLRDEILEHLKKENLSSAEPSKPRVYQPISKIDYKIFEEFASGAIEEV